MSNFLRKFRKDSVQAKYLKYAVGEIFLVVIGILIALSINNWNENRKRNNYELVLLSEIYNVITDDISIIDEFYLKRLDTKEKAIKELSKLTGEEASIADSTFLYLFDELQTDFLFTYDAGPYEALKANGLDRLSSDAIRAILIKTYDSDLPTFKQFIDDYDNFYNSIILQLSFDFLGEEMVKNENTGWEVGRKLIVKNVLKDMSFVKLLSLETAKAINQRDRLNVVVELVKDLQIMISEEIDRLD